VESSRGPRTGIRRIRAARPGIWTSVFFSLVAAGCSTVSPEQLADSEKNLETRLKAKIAQSAAELEQKITAVDSKDASMLALEQKVQNGLEQVEQNVQLLKDANATIADLLQAQRNALRKQLRTVEDKLKALQAASE
jgi:hypothetical protein